jgi:hypothetical protein
MKLLNWGVVAVAAIAMSGSASAQDPYGSASRGFVMSATVPPPAPRLQHGPAIAQATGNYWWSNCPNGQSCNNFAGSFSADLGFAFGPTKSFFAPCGPRVLPDCAGAGCHKCRTPIYGRGPVGPWPGCTYDSYLNH